MSKLQRSRTRSHLAALSALIVFAASLTGGCGACGKKPTDDKSTTPDVRQTEPDTSGVDREKAAKQAEEAAVLVAISTSDDARYISGNLEAEQTPDQPAPDPDPEPRIRETNGSIPTAALQKTFRKYSGQTQKCYERALKKNPSLAGRMYLVLTIDGDGSVARADAQPDSLRSDEVNDCLEKMARGWSFPRPSGGAAKVRKPYTFSPKR